MTSKSPSSSTTSSSETGTAPSSPISTTTGLFSSFLTSFRILLTSKIPRTGAGRSTLIMNPVLKSLFFHARSVDEAIHLHISRRLQEMRHRNAVIPPVALDPMGMVYQIRQRELSAHQSCHSDRSHHRDPNLPLWPIIKKVRRIAPAIAERAGRIRQKADSPRPHKKLFISIKFYKTNGEYRALNRSRPVYCLKFQSIQEACVVLLHTSFHLYNKH